MVSYAIFSLNRLSVNSADTTPPVWGKSMFSELMSKRYGTEMGNSIGLLNHMGIDLNEFSDATEQLTSI